MKPAESSLSAVVRGPDDADSTVIWLHGLGANGTDFLPVIPHLGLGDTKFIFPNAPSMPVTINMGYVMPAWYDIRHMGPGPDRESEAGIRSSAKMIEALINVEVERGVAPSRIVLVGFSQGGAMALHVGLRCEHALAGIAVLSAYELLADTQTTEAHEANTGTSILFCHGRHDEVVPMARGYDAYQACKSLRRACDWHEFEMGHEVCMAEVNIIGQWLRGCLVAS